MIEGSCLCGAVKWRSDGPVSDPSLCHCVQCRKQSGHCWASVGIPRAGLHRSGDVRWHASSSTARRGFCPVCGSFLFWEGAGDTNTGVSLGSVDGPSGLTLQRHIFTAFKGDYYEISDGVKQEAGEDG